MLCSTLTYLIKNDISNRTGISTRDIVISLTCGKDSPNATPLTIAKEQKFIRFSFTLPALYNATIAILTSKNIIIASALGMSGNDIVVSTGDIIKGSDIQEITMYSTTVGTTLIPYYFQDSDYPTKSYNGLLTVVQDMMNNVSYQAFLTTLARLLYNDIATQTTGFYPQIKSDSFRFNVLGCQKK